MKLLSYLGGKGNQLYLLSTSVPWGNTPYNGLYGKAPPERGTFFRLQVYERVEKCVILVYKRT